MSSPDRPDDGDDINYNSSLDSDAEAPSSSPRDNNTDNANRSKETDSLTKENDSIESSNKTAVLFLLAVFAFLLGGGIVAGVWWIMDGQKDDVVVPVAPLDSGNNSNSNSNSNTPNAAPPTAPPVRNPTLSFTSKPTNRPAAAPTAKPVANSSPSPTPLPTNPPTAPRPNLSNPDRLADEHGPLVPEVAQWLFDTDAYQPADYAEFEERYALAVFYQKTSGSNFWKVNTNWMSATSPCENWYGVRCDSSNGGKSVVSIEMDGNSLVGSLPTELGILSALTSISILNCFELSGSIPTTLSRLTDLRRIAMRSNYLSGSIPTQISDLQSLTSLDLENNILSGNLPSTLSQLVNLLQLSAGGNELKGGFPEGFVNLTNLRILELDRNQMSGSLPDMTAFRFLETLDLKTNAFTGDVPVLPDSLQICDLDWNYFVNTTNGIAKGCF